MSPYTYMTEEIEHIQSQLHINMFTKKNTLVTYRALNHYQENDLLLSIRNEDSKWRRFDGVELVWIYVIYELRRFGVRIEDIANLKANIFHQGVLGNIDRANFINNSFDSELALSIFHKYQLYIVVFSDFNFTYHDSHTTNQWRNKTYKDEPHINIPLDKIIQDVWSQIMAYTM